jgi:hypothetical protein
LGSARHEFLDPASASGYGREVRGSTLRRVLFGLAGACAGIALAWWFASGPAPDVNRARAPSAPAPSEPAPAQPAPAPEAAPAAVGERDETSAPWAAIDLEAVRVALPNNLYWQMSAPTDDARILRDREEERARWNVEYGKLLSGTASEAEIHAYYAHRQRLSADYVEFTSWVLDHQASALSEQDVTLLELARRLHLARLEKYPREIQVALDRKLEQDRARAAWLAEEAELGADKPQ